MQKRIPIKNHQQEVQLIGRRVMFALVAVFGLIALLITRLAYLQIYKHDTYITQSTNNRLDYIPIEPTRGLIFDRNGVMLAENIPVFSLDVMPYKVHDFTSMLVGLKKIVSLTPNDINQFLKQIKQHRRFDEIPLKLRLTEKEAAMFAENQYRFPGVIIKARLMRLYPHGESFSHVLGYVGRINAQELNEIDQTNYSASHYIGKLGIEKYYEEELHGIVGYEEVETDATGKPIQTYQEIKAIPGKNIYLTIDSRLQLAVEKALKGHRGAVIAIEPGTGQVLAMVSAPSYDPNIFVSGISQKDYETLQQSADRPLYNRALRGLYMPASTIKPYLALGVLDDGIATPEFSLFDPGWFQIRANSHLFHDWRRLGHGTVNLSKAIITSCDVYFYDLANKMGIHRMNEILKQFGFGEYTGIDLDDELAGVLATPEWKMKAKGIHWYEGDTIFSGIGHGYLQTTILQLASATATLANRGIRLMPYLMLAEQTPGKPIEYEDPVPLDPVIAHDSHYWDIIITAMANSVNLPQGTAFHFGRHPNYTIAAKTGTAQLSKRRNPDEEDKQEDLPEKLRDHHLFIAFAPIDKPKLALAVVTENSNTAIDTARQIFDFYLGNSYHANRRLQAQTEKNRLRS